MDLDIQYIQYSVHKLHNHIFNLRVGVHHYFHQQYREHYR